MIDTLVLRIHNLSQYPKIYEQFYKPSQKKNDVSQSIIIEDTGEIIERIAFIASVYHDNNRVIPLSYRSNINIASSHYALSYWLNTSKDYLEFNFSLPKYLYATNLFQFVNPQDYSAKFVFLQLKAFISQFLKQNFITPPALEDVEIDRMDLCYNQFFNSKEDALQYLNEQEKLLIKFARSSKNKVRKWNDESWTYVTRRWSFKVYHKGTEFAKHDYRQLVKDNHFNYNLQYLKDTSDRILRYEMTIRNTYLNYILKQQFYSSKEKTENQKFRLHPVNLMVQKLLTYTSQKAYAKGKKTIAEKWFSRKKKFTVKSIFDNSKDFIAQSDGDTVTFDETIFSLLYDDFWNHLKKFQLDCALDLTSIQKKINDYNEANELKNKLRRKQIKGLQTARMVMPALLSQFINLADLRSLLPKSTYYDMIRDLKKIGITDKASKLTIPNPRIDYDDYKIYLIPHKIWTGF